MHICLHPTYYVMWCEVMWCDMIWCVVCSAVLCWVLGSHISYVFGVCVQCAHTHLMLTRIFYHQKRHIYHRNSKRNAMKRSEKNVARNFCVYSVFTFESHLDKFLLHFFEYEGKKVPIAHRLPNGKCTYFWYVRNVMHLHHSSSAAAPFSSSFDWRTFEMELLLPPPQY